MRTYKFLVMPLVLFIGTTVAMSKSKAPSQVFISPTNFVPESKRTSDAISMEYLTNPKNAAECRAVRAKVFEKAYRWAEGNCANAKSRDNNIRPAVEFEASRCSPDEKCVPANSSRNNGNAKVVFGINVWFGSDGAFLFCGDMVPAKPVVRASCFQGRSSNIPEQKHPPGKQDPNGP